MKYYKRRKKENNYLIYLIGVFTISFIVKSGIDIEGLLSDSSKYIIWFGLIILSIVICSFYMDFMKKRKRKLNHINSGIDMVDKMDGFEFEHFLKHHFEALGYKASVTSESYDFGADLIAEINGEKIVIQAKRYKGNVGIKAIQEVIGAISYYKAHRGYVISNSYFTKSAIELAQANNIELWDRNKLIEIMSKNSGKTIANEVLETTMFEGNCPVCKGKLILRDGSRGQFFGCSNYPKCTFTRNV